MPELEGKTETEVALEFEVICATCNRGMCGDVDTRYSNGRGCPQVMVPACPDCMKEKDDEIEDLKSQIEELESQIE